MHHDPPPRSTQHTRPADEALRVLQRVRERDIRFINLEFTDVAGTAKCVTIPAAQLGDVLARGKWFDGSAIENLARVAETDMYLRPDLTTYAEVPWRAMLGGVESGAANVARLICDVLTPAGERFAGDPRAVLLAALEVAAGRGYRYEVAPELEFFLLREQDGKPAGPLPHDRGSYFDLAIGAATDVRREIAAELERMEIAVESSHHEVAAGQHEIDFAPADALHIADGVVTARYAIKAIALRHGLWATFMPKPYFGVIGSGMHTHQRLLDVRDGKNAFADAGDVQYGLSAVGRWFLAGQLAHAQGMSAVVAPLVNSYKRLVQGYEAPVMVSWARLNREALLRVPRVAVGEPETMRVELRSPDPSCNPYLAFAVMLRAGLDEIARELALPAPVEEELIGLDELARLHKGIALLPATLGEALSALQEDGVVQAALGEAVSAWFAEAKMAEWHEYRRQVHAWELDRYLAVY